MRHCRGGIPTKKCLFHFYLANISRGGIGPSVFTLAECTGRLSSVPSFTHRKESGNIAIAVASLKVFPELFNTTYSVFQQFFYVSCHHQFLAFKLLKCSAILKYENGYYTVYVNWQVGCLEIRTKNYQLNNRWTSKLMNSVLIPYFKNIYLGFVTYSFRHICAMLIQFFSISAYKNIG